MRVPLHLSRVCDQCPHFLPDDVRLLHLGREKPSAEDGTYTGFVDDWPDVKSTVFPEQSA